jgi:hypothetical protein
MSGFVRGASSSSRPSSSSSSSSRAAGYREGIGLVERRRRRRRIRRDELRTSPTTPTNAIPNIDFDFPDDAYTKLLRNENYHQVGERLKNITKRGEVSFNFPKNILDGGNVDGRDNDNFEVMPEIPFESLPEIGFALGLSVFSGFWALWEAFGKKAVFGDQEEEDRVEGNEFGDGINDDRRGAKRKRERHIVQGVDVTLFPIFKDEVVLKAVKFAEEKHKGQTRKTGEPYVTHLVEAARILAAALPEPRDQNKFGSTTQEKLRETISACLLVATLDDPNSKSSNLLKGEMNEKMVLELRENFGNATAELVLQAARMGKVMAGVRRRQRRKRRENSMMTMSSGSNNNNSDSPIEKEEEEEEEIDDNEKLEELLLDVVKDPRVFLIKIAERVHNMRTLYALDPRKAETVADETLRVWCSFAEKLGIWTVKSELEDMCFAVLEPGRFEEIVRSRDEFWLEESKRGRFRGKNFKGTIAPEFQEDRDEKDKSEREFFALKTKQDKNNYVMMDALDEAERDPSWMGLNESQRALRRRLQCVQPFEALTTRDGGAMRIDEKVLRESPMRPATRKSLEALAQWQNNMFQTLRLDGVVLNVNVRMSSRLKSLFSTSEKMKRKNVPFSEVYDGRATRIIVGDPVPTIASGGEGGESEFLDKDKIDSGLPSEIEACYALLHAVHKIYRPINGEYDDYITKPKKSGYKSLHTAVLGDDGKPLEVQIRTRGMHDAAEWGVAAHWLYKTKTENKSSKKSSKKSQKDEGTKDKTPRLGQVVQLISPTSRAGGGVVVGVETAGRCTVAKPISSRRSAMTPDATEWALELNGHENLLQEVNKKKLKSARQETKEYYILEFCLYEDGRWHERDQLGKAGRITMEPLDIFVKLGDDEEENVESQDAQIVKKEAPDRMKRMIMKWQKANQPLGIIRSQGLRDEFDEKMSDIDKEAYLTGAQGWNEALARSQPPAPGPYFTPKEPSSTRDEVQFTRTEAAKLEAELALSTKRNGKNEALQSATVDLTSKGLLVVTWDDTTPALRSFSPGTTAGTVRKQMALEASASGDDKKKKAGKKALVLDSKYVNVNSVMVTEDTQLQDADCVFLDDLAVY